MKNNLIPISIFALALSILIIGYQYLDVYKIKNNYNTINVSTVEIIDNLTPTVLYATFNVDFGKYDLNKGPSFEQNNAIKILTEKIKNKFIKENIKDATINWGTLSNFSTSSNYKTQIRIYVPIKNEIDESKLNQLLKEFNPESLYISKNVNDKEYEELSSKVENLNLAKNRKQADEKAKVLKTRVIDVASNIKPQDTKEYYNQSLNNMIEENTDGTIRITNYTNVYYVVSK